MKLRSRNGAALMTVIVLTGAVMIMLGGVFSYVVFAQRASAIAVGRDVCRLAAQSEIELAKSAIFHQFQMSLNRSARIVGGSTIGTQTASSFDWFVGYKGSKTKKSIGTKYTLTFADSVSTKGCDVKVRIGRVDHVAGTQWADVTIVAHATRRNPGGTFSEVTLAEMVRFAQQRSSVFNNAYFVNNYGWFQGSGATANGDVRANGDMYLDTSAVINGHIYAAKNDELKVKGDVSSTATMHKASDYRSKMYGPTNFARPLLNDPYTGAVNAAGYDAPNQVTSDVLKNRVHANQAMSVEMPYIGDISSNESEYRKWAEELHAENSNMCTIKQNGRTLVSVYYDGVGPSGLTTVKDSNGKDVTAADYGAIILDGTTHPIEINGPVIIPSDVIIKGKVKGQGTIYSGRNIHIVGDITYVNPPTWDGKSTRNSNNASKDMLGLMAKGNIVLGNYSDYNTSTTSGGYGWSASSTFEYYLYAEPYVQKYTCDTSDAAIGYPATFGGSYLAQEYVSNTDFNNCKNAGLAEFTPGGYNASTGRFGQMKKKIEKEYYTETTEYYDRWGRKQTKTENKSRDVVKYYTSYDRRYFQSVCEDEVVNGLSSGVATLSRVDAVLYNNHGIFGKIGSCTFNGALVCRNEGIRYTTQWIMNWDSRLYSGSNETVSNDKVGLAKSSDARPVTLWWMEIPNGLVEFD